MMDAYIFLLDDLLKFDSYKLVSAVASEHQKHSKYPNFFINLWSNSIFFTDKWFFNTIQNYNKGLITTDQFVIKMSSQFSLGGSEFVDIWKSIYQISPDIKDKFINKINSLNKSEIFIAGVTNEIHFKHFLEQLDQAIDKKNDNFYRLLSYKSLNYSDSIQDLVTEVFHSDDFLKDYNILICSSKILEISGINLSQQCCIDPVC
jgi:hypothetical protein